MSRDQKPGRANIIDGSAEQGRAALPVAPPAPDAVAAAAVAAAADVAPVPVRLFVILFIAASAVAGTGVAMLATLSS